MSTSPCFNVQHTTRAVMEWQFDNATRILAKPDPKVSSITLMTRFDSRCAFFDVRIPLKLKGLDTTTDITLRACASSITSLDLVKNPIVPNEVEQEFESTALCLRFQLSCNLDILVPTLALEPPCPGRARSGLVLDAVREFTQATVFSIYIEARDAPSPELHSISDAISRGLFKPPPNRRYQLASMYAGLGAKVVQFPVESTIAPPAYDQTEPPPPPPPIEPKNDRKRPRQDTQTERVDDIGLIWAELQMLKKAKDEDSKRIEALERRTRN
ncbi:hypothetical protein F53441_14118 [Fusarium austroafricanum]|uniref:Uncharacterized protein n=1 Tax=Fusarium austroafricanum TaxID=2364996 RepID=A0A8H4NEQ4_9HYPO|nr:hypothetical protein F53441_14118 [Fusarium austroafricanum]